MTHDSRTVAPGLRPIQDGTVRAPGSALGTMATETMSLAINFTEAFRDLVQIGIALTSERDLSTLLHRILTEARRFTRAEAGTLFLRENDELHFAVVALTTAREGGDRVVPSAPEYGGLVRPPAPQAAVATRTAGLEALSFKEALTAVSTRRYFIVGREGESRRHLRFAEPVSL